MSSRPQATGRTVHGYTSFANVVRCDSDRHWYLEPFAGNPRVRIDVIAAANLLAHAVRARVGRHYAGLCGGRTFDRLMSQRVGASTVSSGIGDLDAHTRAITSYAR